jgi:hypothetical protein
MSKIRNLHPAILKMIFKKRSFTWKQFFTTMSCLLTFVLNPYSAYGWTMTWFLYNEMVELIYWYAFNSIVLGQNLIFWWDQLRALSAEEKRKVYILWTSNGNREENMYGSFPFLSVFPLKVQMLIGMKDLYFFNTPLSHTRLSQSVLIRSWSPGSNRPVTN